MGYKILKTYAETLISSSTYELTYGNPQMQCFEFKAKHEIKMRRYIYIGVVFPKALPNNEQATLFKVIFSPSVLNKINIKHQSLHVTD